MEAFAKKLASSDGSVRVKAFRALQHWLDLRIRSENSGQSSSLTYRDFLRLWKALFYCMWMSDRATSQMQLAQRMGDLWMIIDEAQMAVGIDAASESAAGLLFVRAFWETACREWSGLDRHRLDKFYNVIRSFVAATVKSISFYKCDETYAAAVNCILKDGPLHPTRSNVPDGLRMYLLESSVEIFAAVLKDESLECKIGILPLILHPYLELLAQTCKVTILKYGNDFLKSLSALEEESKIIGQLVFSRGEKQPIAAARNRKLLYDHGLALQKASEHLQR